jgi:hypothetical protein
MNQNIKNFIENGEKEFERLYGAGGAPDIRPDIKQFISSRQISLTAFLIKMIVEGTREKIQEDLDAGGFNMICSNETTFKNYVMGVLSELTDGK